MRIVLTYPNKSQLGLTPATGDCTYGPATIPAVVSVCLASDTMILLAVPEAGGERRGAE